MGGEKKVGSIGWIDMSTADASGVRDFYKAVVGWETDDVDMGGYADYVMKEPASGEGVAGVCHAKGSNADLPPGWLIYIIVADVDASAAACTKHGGKVLVEPRGLAGGRFCVIEDPGGSVAALYQP
jgi:predicted enzyme related to lactoylglutathione lyase